MCLVGQADMPPPPHELSLAAKMPRGMIESHPLTRLPALSGIHSLHCDGRSMLWSDKIECDARVPLIHAVTFAFSAMAFQETSSTRSRFEAVTKGAYLDLLLPKSNDIDVSKTLRDASPEELARIPSRRNLFFGSLSISILTSDRTDLTLEQTRMRISI